MSKYPAILLGLWVAGSVMAATGPLGKTLEKARQQRDAQQARAQQTNKAEPLQVLLITGLNASHKYHNVEQVSPVLRHTLDQSPRFEVTVGNVNGKPKQFAPTFKSYDVVVSIYNAKPWAKRTQQAFERYMQNGGGFVSVHAANNAFPDWKAYNRIIGVGGWRGRDEKSGPYLHWQDGRIVRETKPGSGGTHGKQWAFPVINRQPSHPILAGLPTTWRQVEDELYARLRGPAKQLEVLATGHSKKTKRHEPLLMTIRYGQGRTFHTTLGHDVEAVRGAGFQHTLKRGAEWAATGEVTLQKPDDFPTAEKSTLRPKPE
jgi:type 1 glutamine amidotransferase